MTKRKAHTYTRTDGEEKKGKNREKREKKTRTCSWMRAGVRKCSFILHKNQMK